MSRRILLAGLMLIVRECAAQTHSPCSGSVALSATSTTQSFSDGSAPTDHYSNNMQCSWTITAPAGDNVRLSFSRFALEPDGSSDGQCIFDWVQVYDGSSAAAPSLGRFCGTSLPSELQSTGAIMHVVFLTDFSVTDAGFQAHYIAVTAGSGE